MSHWSFSRLRGVLLAGFLGGIASIAAAQPATDPVASYKYSGTMPSSLENWPLAQRRLQSDPAWKRWVDSEFVKLRRWQARGGDHADWITGDPHEYLDPATLSALRWTEETPPPAPGLPGTAEAKRFGAWVYYFRSNNISYVLQAARLYRLTGDPAALEWVRSQLNLYAGQYPRWPLQSRLGESRLMGQSLDEASALTVLTPAIRLVAAGVPGQELAAWKRGLVQPMVAGLIRSFHGFNNISVWQRSATAGAALLLEDDTLWGEALNGPQGIVALMRAGLTKDTQWIEGSLGYGDYVVRALLPLLHEAAVYGRAAELEPIRRMAYDLLVAPMTLRFPDATLPNPGDNRGVPRAFNRSLLLEATYLLPTHVGVAEWVSSKGWPQLFVDWNPSMGPAAPLPFESRRMDATGYAMLRRQGWHLFLHFGQASRYHAQYEALSFELQHDQGRVVTDLGTTLYESPLHKNYFTRAAAHNVPIVNDRGQRDYALGRLTAFDADGGRMAAQQSDYQPGATVTRSLALDEKGLMDDIDVRSDRQGQGSFGAVLHLDCGVRLPSLPKVALPLLPPESGFGYWNNAEAFQVPSTLVFEADCEKLPMQIRVDGPSSGILVVGQPPVLDGRRRAAMYFRYPLKDGHVRTSYSMRALAQ